MSSLQPVTHSQQKKNIYLETLGCAKNRVDSEIMLANLQHQGHVLVTEPDQAEIIIVNTCGFLTEASQESIDRILELSDFKSVQSNADQVKCEKLIATGCLSQRYQENLIKQIPEIDGLLGANGFEKIPQLINDLYADGKQHSFINQKPHYKQYEEQARVQTTPRHYTFVKAAEGCSNMCSFCNIPSLRGNFSSRTVYSVVDEIKVLVDKGVKEINIISQDTSSYGIDFKDGTNLSSLLKGISKVKGDFWIRLFYCYPNSFTEEVIEVIANDSRFCRYLDMPFQHINDSVLKDMNRKIDRKLIEKKMESIRDMIPDLAWRTTFIVGFPTETEEHFNELYDFVAEGHFQHVGVFNYSHEDNIRSSKWGDPVPNAIKQERRNRLMELQQSIVSAKQESLVGKKLKVLIDGISEETELLLQGRNEFQGPDVDGLVYINEGHARPGTFHDVEITEAHVYDLVGKIV